MLDLYLNYIQESNKEIKINNKGFSFGFFPESEAMILIFETNWSVTGKDNAYLLVDKVNSINDLKIGKEFKLSFGQNWTLNFKEVLNKYGKSHGSGKTFKKGKYSGNGVLFDNNKCNWSFTSNILKGIYTITNSKGSSFIFTRIS